MPLSANRRMVIASVSQNKRSGIHCVTEVDVSVPRQLIRRYRDKNGEGISFTAYIAKCLSDTLEKYPEMNSFIRRNQLVILEDITISVLVEREIEGDSIPEPVSIVAAQKKSMLEIHNEVRTAQAVQSDQLGDLTGASWIRFIPRFLLKTFIRIADRNISMAKKYGKVAITAIGMFSQEATWFIPHGTATILLTIGSISTKQIKTDEGPEWREFLHLTATFDHDIIDGAPAARFMKTLVNNLSTANNLKSLFPNPQSPIPIRTHEHYHPH